MLRSSLSSSLRVSTSFRQVGISRACARLSTTATSPSDEDNTLRRSYLYVPASSSRMLEKSLTTNSDVIIYDLEDSVPPSVSDKDSARQRLSDFLSNTPVTPRPDRVAVRVNDITTPFFQSDISQVLKLSSVRTLILPKIHAPEDLHYVSRAIRNSIIHDSSRDPSIAPLDIVASIESARSTYNLGNIASWKSEYGPTIGSRLRSLLFASEDYCADTSVIRTKSRQELLFVRSQIVITAKAFGLNAIDMVCINYKDLDYLKDECEDGRKLGFDGKQAIHPTQVETIQSTFVPSSQEIIRAAKILQQMEAAHSSQRGAFGLEMADGGKEMIDAPMLKQALKIIHAAKMAGLEIPT